MDITFRNIEITSGKVKINYVEHAEDHDLGEIVNAQHSVNSDKQDNDELVREVQKIKPYMLMLCGFTLAKNIEDVEEHIRQKYAVSGFILSGHGDQQRITIKAQKSCPFNSKLMKIKTPSFPVKNPDFDLSDRFETLIIELEEYIESYIKERKYMPESNQMEIFEGQD